jgi:hypothetical protein
MDRVILFLFTRNHIASNPAVTKQVAMPGMDRPPFLFVAPKCQQNLIS